MEITGAPEPLDVAVSWTRDRKALTISIINPTYETQRLSFSVLGANLAPQGKAWVLTAADDMAYNDPGKPSAVTVTEQKVGGLANGLEVAPASATILACRGLMFSRTASGFCQ